MGGISGDKGQLNQNIFKINRTKTDHKQNQNAFKGLETTNRKTNQTIKYKLILKQAKMITLMQTLWKQANIYLNKQKSENWQEYLKLEFYIFLTFVS